MLSVLPPYPRKLGTDVPIYAEHATYELPKIEFTEQTKTVYELTQDLAKLWGLDPVKAAKLTGDVPFEEATLMKLNCDKALAYLHWHSTLHYEECVKFIADWYRAFYVEKDKEMYTLTEKQIKEFENAAKAQNLQWAK